MGWRNVCQLSFPILQPLFSSLLLTLPDKPLQSTFPSLNALRVSRALFITLSS